MPHHFAPQMVDRRPQHHPLGRGIFTTKKFEKGDYVAPYEGKIITPEENKKLWIKYGRNMAVYGKYVVDCQQVSKRPIL